MQAPLKKRQLSAISRQPTIDRSVPPLFNADG